MRFQENELPKVAEYLLKTFENYKVWCFYGEMGMGKTTLIKEICRQLGVGDEMSSPTFGIVNEYLGVDQQKIYHFDFYRIKDEAEAEDIGPYEYFDSGSYCFIEWPEKIENLLPEEYLKINIILVDQITRDLIASVND